MNWQSLVLKESADWVSLWSPPDAVVVDTGRIRFYVDRGVASVLRAEPDDAARVEDLVDEVLTLTARAGAARLKWTVRPGPIAEKVIASLIRRGGVIDELVDICAWDLRFGVPEVPVPPDVDVRPVRTREDVALAQRVDAEVWGYRELTDDEIDKQAANLWPGRFVAVVNGEPAGSAGYTIVDSSTNPGDSVARMFGAGVVPSLRRRGVYRGLLAARLNDARKRGAALALVHARSGTSGPVLRRLGFIQAGQQTVVDVPIADVEAFAAHAAN